VFWEQWSYVYGPPVSFLTDNGPQFTDKFFQAVCAEQGIQKVFTTDYIPQINGQVEHSKRTILASFRGYFSAQKDERDEFTFAVTFVSNCIVQSILRMTPFELELSRSPRTLSLPTLPRSQELIQVTEKKYFLEWLKT
jgi:transposase InsO family protein